MAALPAANFNVVAVLVLALPNAAVTAAGRPVAARATELLKPLTPTTLIEVLAPAAPAKIVSVLAEEETLKLGTGTVNAIVVALVTVPAAPVMVTV